MSRAELVLCATEDGTAQNVDLTAANIYLQADELALAIDSTQLMELDLTEAKFIRGAKKPAGGNDAA